MLTFFTTPKSFTGLYSIIQRNAIRSWKEECPQSEILLLGNEQGMADVAKGFGIRHVSDVEVDEFEVPWLNKTFEHAEKAAKNQIMAWINSDCIIVGNLEQTTKTVKEKFKNFLMILSRYDSQINELLPKDNWQKFVTERKGKFHWHVKKALRKKTLPQATGMDLFVFPKGLYSNIPAFHRGGSFYDGWLVYDAWRRKIPTVDITGSILLIHQEHPSRKLSPNYKIKETRNRKLSTGKKYVRDANFVLENGKLLIKGKKS